VEAEGRAGAEGEGDAEDDEDEAGHPAGGAI
jgi:hypothetical protein